MKNICVLTNEVHSLHQVVEACSSTVLNARVNLIIANTDCDTSSVEKYSTDNNIALDMQSFENNDAAHLVHKTAGLNRCDLIVCLGYGSYLNLYAKDIPTLYVYRSNHEGENLNVSRILEKFRSGHLSKTGFSSYLSLNSVTEKILTEEFELFADTTEKQLQFKFLQHEPDFVIRSIEQALHKKTIAKDLDTVVPKLIYQGKVRDIYDIGYDRLAFVHSDRLSAFDRHVCDVPNKGRYLTYMSDYWFKKTRSIVDNHLLYSHDNVMICKKCTPIKIEVVVRGYITGQSSTSLWTHYKKGDRTYCGITFPDGLVKDQKLEQNVVTPTTKGEHDVPISAEEIVEQGYMTKKEWDFVSSKALELFEFGQFVAAQRGLILVDTKYEFGYDSNGKIILMDEIHTCDSSRFWIADTYAERFANGQSPQKLDKDLVRDYLSKLPSYDKYKDDVPEIPDEVVAQTTQAYGAFLSRFDNYPDVVEKQSLSETVNEYFSNHCPKAVIVSGSIKDKVWSDKIAGEMSKLNIYSEQYYISAHKNTAELLKLLGLLGDDIVFVAVAGMSNALGGVIASNSKHPTINCPPFSGKDDMATNINSSLQNPSNVPVATILSPLNTALFTRKIMAGWQ